MSSPFAPSGGTLDNPSIITTNVQGPSLQILALSMQSPNVSNHRRAHSPRKSDNYYFPDLPNLLSLYRNSMTTTIPNSLPLFEDSKLGKIAATMNTVPIDGTLISPTAKLSVATIDQGRKEGETSSQKLLIPLDRVGPSPVEIAFIINLKVPTLSKEGNINGTQVEGQFAIEKTKKENDVAGMECSSQ
ncbi:hypothetical protein GH714_010801 [Hevea brasiliensis]|uniref:Uncharacterized protein n=1 Tax=Hevea brasiliensis TaxID=3981 RepID=A0A6A6KNQ8_HEVBR|nr:hypothetical protein GH714_010801 [Hevea brasiliensis]